MALTRYRRFLKLCEEWPVEETKRGRDLGTFLRQRISDPVTCDEMFESLARIHTNYYKTKYPRLKDTSFTGVSVEECKLVIATDSLKQMEEGKKGKWTKLRERFSAKNPEEESK
ncbi:ubiquinol-cytochrome-c reductase complex assembly factor 2 isoform X2 [Hemicordylus capensis]|uniref:ubiquinol-cytochrome-c reductase complex assembly factor 2 isoform X2 n=1 Tax=Hemicordylus capensis TaxID=884348 RepID=UPI0023043F7F|nr:ubiquinol-cytochrome-c reductase complex assembly factor 2 isoform X2 [Hemicordylus capensis]